MQIHRQIIGWAKRIVAHLTKFLDGPWRVVTHPPHLIAPSPHEGTCPGHSQLVTPMKEWKLHNVPMSYFNFSCRSHAVFLY